MPTQTTNIIIARLYHGRYQGGQWAGHDAACYIAYMQTGDIVNEYNIHALKVLRDRNPRQVAMLNCIGVGDGRAGGARAPLKFGETYFSGNYYEKNRAFFGQKCRAS